MTGQNNMSEQAAVRNESHQETFWSSLKDNFNFRNFICLGSFVLFWQILLKVKEKITDYHFWIFLGI